MPSSFVSDGFQKSALNTELSFAQKNALCSKFQSVTSTVEKFPDSLYAFSSPAFHLQLVLVEHFLI